MGSMTFNVCLVAFMLQTNFHLAEISLILGLQRFVPVLIMGIWGHLTDRLNPRLTIIVLEVGAAVASLGLLALWQGRQTNYWGFLVLCVVRAIMVNFQTGSKVRITKLLADSSYSSNAKHAIWQMKSTQGATLFAGVAGLFLIQRLSMESAILLDLATFIINGAIMFLVSFDRERITAALNAIPSWKQKFSDLFIYNPQAAVLDIMLAVSIAGLISFIARVSGDNHIWNAIFLTSYGLSVWVAGFLERSFARKFSSIPFWIVLGVTFALIGQSDQPNMTVLALMFAKDISYWIILHRISGHFQADTPLASMGAVSSARFSIMVVILSIGEILVGAWSPVVPLWFETMLRAGVALSVGVYLLNRNPAGLKAVASERPAL